MFIYYQNLFCLPFLNTHVYSNAFKLGQCEKPICKPEMTIDFFFLNNYLHYLLKTHFWKVKLSKSSFLMLDYISRCVKKFLL